MTVYSDKQAMQDLDAVLQDATAHGEVRILRENGEQYVLKPIVEPSRDMRPLCEEKQRDLSDLVGSWVEEPEFEAALAAQRQIDPELWK